MKEIPLTKGYVAIVDDEDYEELMRFPWHVGSIRDHGPYAQRHGYGPGEKRTVSMHRAIMHAPPHVMVDHRNGNGLDNRKANLRFCTNSENQRNRRQCYGVSIYKGVVFNKKANKWAARIKHNGVNIWLGCFESEIQAAYAYDDAAHRLFGVFACCNMPDWEEVEC
jgi:hypothetical protein